MISCLWKEGMDSQVPALSYSTLPASPPFSLFPQTSYWYHGPHFKVSGQVIMIGKNPLLSILLGAVFISFSGIWVAWAALAPPVSAFYRVFFGTIILFAGCLFKKEIHLPNLKSSILILVCAISFAGDLVCWHASIAYIGPGLSTIIGNFQVFILTFISITVFGQRISVRFIVSLPLAIFGLFLIVGFDWSALPERYLFGLLLALMTAVLYSVFLLCLRQLQASQPQVSPMYNLLIVSAASSALLVPAVIFSEASFTIPTLASFGSLVGLALFSQTIGWILITTNLPHVVPSAAGLLLLLQPALAFVWDVLIFSRPTTLSNWTGVCIVLTAIYLGMSSSQADTSQQ